MTDIEGVGMDRENGESTRGCSSAEEFRRFLIDRLGGGWKVKIIAQVPSPRESGEVMSVAAEASNADSVTVHVTHDRGADVVLLSLGGDSQIPFEDLAVAKGKIDMSELIHLGIQALTNPPGNPAFDLETTLRLIREWDDDLAGDLDPANQGMAQELKDITEEFERALAAHCKLKE